MIEYGTIEYYQKTIKELETEKEILLNALENVARKESSDFDLLDKIAEKISNTNNSLKWQQEELAKLYAEKSESRSE